MRKVEPLSFEEISDPITRSTIKEEMDIKQGLEELRDPNWLLDLSYGIDKSHKGLGHASYLALLAAVTAPLPPIPYTSFPIRSKINVLFQGPPRCGKGLIMDMIRTVSPDCQQMGTASSAALTGTIDKFGNWTPGKAFYSRNRTLIIRELFQSFRRGEHYQDLVWDMNELIEYPHVVSKTLGSLKIPSLRLEALKQKYPGVDFVHENEFTYKAPCAVIGGVPAMGLEQMYSRVTDGFLSRFVLVNINYDRREAQQASDNFWDNVMPEENSDENVDDIISKVDLEMYARMMRTLYLASESEFNVTGAGPIERFQLGRQEREILKSETKRAMLEAWDRVVDNLPGHKAKDDSASISPPILFCGEQDVLRIAVADAASRRFSGTETEPGVIQLDRKAIMTALRFLPVIVETSVEMHTEAYRISGSSTKRTARPMVFSGEYEIVYRMGPAGLTEEAFFAICKESDLQSEAAGKRLKMLVDSGLVERKADGKIFAVIYKRL